MEFSSRSPVEVERLKMWSSHQVAQWLVENGFQNYKENFLRHEITGDILLDLSYNILGDIGVSTTGDRVKILQALKKSFAPSIPKLPKVLGRYPSQGKLQSRSPNTYNIPRSSSLKEKNGNRGSIRRESKRRSKRESKGEKAKTNSFFGERPPDEVIVDQLEDFFPEIDTHRSNMDKAVKLKSIVQANLDNKRSSRRVSSIMLRRQTQRFSTISNLYSEVSTTAAPALTKHISTRPQIGAARRFTKAEEAIMTRDSISVKSDRTLVGSVTDSKKPKPISFKWTPGRLIGQGAFGKVFHALNLDNGEFMAVKQVLTSQDNTQQKKMTDSLLREIELLSELDHDNIVRYFGFQEGDDTAFNVFLEYVAGGSISSVLSKCGKLDEQIARSLAAQILCGLEYLHSRDIIHRDIKGANILVTGDGIVKISDFGISKKNEYTAYHRMTRMSMQGSINWMAPEVARGKGYSAKVDIWSCGCLVLEMLTGQVPWHNVRGNVIYLLGTGNSPPLPPSLSEMAKHFLETAFTIDPEMRPTATTLLEHTFTDIDITQVDFEKWSTEAMRIQSELESTDSEDDSEYDDSEEDSDTESEGME